MIGASATIVVTDDRLLRIHGRGHDSLLVCFHHAGGGASSFAGWPRRLSDCADVGLVQLPGREDRLDEPLQVTLSALSTHLASVLASLGHDRLVLLGHSMGATIAWWVAAELWLGHGMRASVVVSSRAAPSLTHIDWEPVTNLASWFKLLGEQPPTVLEQVELLAIFRQTLGQDMAWMQREFHHALPGPFPLDLICLCADDDQLASFSQMSDWRRFTSAQFEIHQLPGGHFHLLNHPETVVGVVLDLLKREHLACNMN